MLVSTCKLARVVFKWMVEYVVFDVTLTENVKRFNNVIIFVCTIMYYLYD